MGRTRQRRSSNHSTSMPEQPKPPSRQGISHRHDVILWFSGLVFIAGLAAAILGVGAYRGWDANSGYSHNISATSKSRFWPEPFQQEPGVPGRFGADATGRWYYWKLAPDEVTIVSEVVMWVCYAGHNLLFWLGLYKLQSLKMKQREVALLQDSSVYSSGGIGFWNWYLFIVNIAFHLVHFGQTHWTYDALAQDVSIASSQSSVIMLLIFIMVLEYRDRGLFFGWPSQFDNGKWSTRLRLPYSAMYLVRKYHGYAFSWAAIYTFWYHPMENTWGHVFGFFHTYIILLQGSLAFTPFHLNKYWRFFLEVWVTAHGGVVAAQTGGPDMLGTKLWPMFVFGFLMLIVLTQLYGLPFWRKIPAWTRIFPLLAYIVLVVAMYSWIPDAEGKPWVRMQEIIRIPGVYYLYFFVVWGWTLLLLWVRHKSQGSAEGPVGTVTKVACLVGVVAIYVCFVGVSVAAQWGDVKVNMIALMIGLTGLFSVGCCVANVLLHVIFRAPVLTGKWGRVTDVEKWNDKADTSL